MTCHWFFKCCMHTLTPYTILYKGLYRVLRCTCRKNIYKNIAGHVQMYVRLFTSIYLHSYIMCGMLYVCFPFRAITLCMSSQTIGRQILGATLNNFSYQSYYREITFYQRMPVWISSTINSSYLPIHFASHTLDDILSKN